MPARRKQTARRIVIVGGGVAGLSIAVRLAQSGLAVTVLEAGRLGQAASTKNQGWLYSGAWFAPQQPDLARMCHESLEQTIRFCPQCLEPATVPMIFVMSSHKTLPSRWTKAWEVAGIPFQDVDLRTVVNQTGIPESLVQHAYRLPDRAFRSHILLECLTAQAEHLGVEVRTESPVTDFIRTADRIDGVVASHREEIAARLVVLAANVGGVPLWPSSVKTGEQPVFQRIGLKTHCLAVRPKLADAPFCVVDVEGFNHIPHGHVSAFGTSRWVAVLDIAEQQASVPEIDHLWGLLGRFYPYFERSGHDIVEWAGLTVQAMHFDQVEPGLAPMPTVIDHEHEPPRARNLLSVFPGRASLWPQLAEATRVAVLDKLDDGHHTAARPPWALDLPRSASASSSAPVGNR
jgi:glycine/D-amino acid oxidase-like deaminating enzyme